MDCMVTGGAGFIGSNLVDALIERGDRVAVIDNLFRASARTWKRALGRGASAARARCPRRRLGRRSVRGHPAPARIPPGRPDRRSLLGRAPGRRCAGNVLGTIAVLEARSPARSAPRGQQLHRRRAVRGRRAAAHARGFPDPAAGAVRPGQVRGRGLLRAVLAAARSVDDLAALRQRLRTAPGRPRRGRRGRDLLRLLRGGAASDGVRRRPADARLGRGSDVVRANLLAADSDLGRAGEHRPRAGDLGARAARTP